MRIMRIVHIQSSSSLSVWESFLCTMGESWMPILLYRPALAMTAWISKIHFFYLKMTTELLLALYVVSTWIVKLRRRVFSKFESSKDEGNFTKELIKVKRYSRLRNVLNGCSLLKPLEWSTVPPEKPQPCVCVWVDVRVLSLDLRHGPVLPLYL